MLHDLAAVFAMKFIELFFGYWPLRLVLDMLMQFTRFERRLKRSYASVF